eukprot:TRINITY_DN23_c0_g1_i1.p1 TRINITY_DN23_c0_g1~~TRINITY_DN23_c0_g1_i1.p1  ORF type:complete len:233 (-),score=35.48 TRINITY_DN23_c0_g1_i1:166-864(-)
MCIRDRYQRRVRGIAMMTITLLFLTFLSFANSQSSGPCSDVPVIPLPLHFQGLGLYENDVSVFDEYFEAIDDGNNARWSRVQEAGFNQSLNLVFDPSVPIGIAWVSIKNSTFVPFCQDWTSQILWQYNLIPGYYWSANGTVMWQKDVAAQGFVDGTSHYTWDCKKNQILAGSDVEYAWMTLGWDNKKISSDIFQEYPTDCPAVRSSLSEKTSQRVERMINQALRSLNRKDKV